MAIENPFITPERSTRFYSQRSSTVNTRSEFRGLPFLAFIRSNHYVNTRKLSASDFIKDLSLDERPEKRRRQFIDFGMDRLPYEILNEILDHLHWWERWQLRSVSKQVSFTIPCIGRKYRCLNKQFFVAATSIYAYQTMDLGQYITDSQSRHISPAKRNLSTLPLIVRTQLLPHVSNLSLSHESLHLFEIVNLFATINFQNLSRLNLSFIKYLDEDVVESVDVEVRFKLKSLVLRGCRYIHDGARLATLVPNVEHLDFSWSGLIHLPDTLACVEKQGLLDDITMTMESDTTLVELDTDSEDEEADRSSITLVEDPPTQLERPWSQLKSLDLTGCSHLDPHSLSQFLCDPHLTPPHLMSINLSCLDGSILTPYLFQRFNFLKPCQANQCYKESSYEPNALSNINLSWCDSVTLQDVKELKSLAHSQRSLSLLLKGDDPDLKVVHTSILECEDEIGYRKFINLFTRVETFTD